MSTPSQIRVYNPPDCAVFRSTKERFGGLSNMAGGFPIYIDGILIRSSEALYQACRFPHASEVQRYILAQISPMTAKMVGKPYRSQTREDWDQVRVRIMRWCLRVKLCFNRDKFGLLLLSTRDMPIVEDSKRDHFWGAKQQDDGSLMGMNVLGRLLMELREEYKEKGSDAFNSVAPPAVPMFLLLDREIGLIQYSSDHRQLFRTDAV